MWTEAYKDPYPLFPRVSLKFARRRARKIPQAFKLSNRKLLILVVREGLEPSTSAL